MRLDVPLWRQKEIQVFAELQTARNHCIHAEFLT